jgi:hypothetical protein
LVTTVVTRPSGVLGIGADAVGVAERAQVVDAVEV